MPAKAEVRVDTLLEHGQPPLLQPVCLVAALLQIDVCKSGAAPERQRVSEQRAGAGRIVRRTRRVGQLLEPVQV